MSSGLDPPIPADITLLEQSVPNLLRTSAKLALENLKEEGWVDNSASRPRTEVEHVTLGCAVILCSAARDSEATTGPPSISLRSVSDDRVFALSHLNCPHAIRDFLNVWSQTVPAIRALSPEQLNDVRRRLFGLAPLTATGDPHFEGIAAAVEAVASVLGTWCTRRDPLLSTLGIGSPALELDAPCVGGQLDSMPRKKRQQAEDTSVSNTTPPKRPRGRHRKNPVPQKSTSSKEVPKSYEPTPTPVPAQLAHTPKERPQVRWGLTACSLKTTRTLLPPPAGKRPTIWATSRDELCTVLPELGQVLNNIVFEGTETPILFIDGPCDAGDEWGGGKTMRLSMTRTFECSTSQTAVNTPYDVPTQLWQPISQGVARNSVPEGVYNAELELHVFPRDVDDEPAAQTLPAFQNNPVSHSNSTARGDVSPLLAEDAPTEIRGLIRAQQSRVPVNVILCRGARLAAFGLPDGCGCAYLGFFFISDMVVTTLPRSLDEKAEGPCVRGAVTWTFSLDWTPGGEDPDALTALRSLPWWMEDPSEPSAQAADPASEEEIAVTDNTEVPLQHPYTLLPLHFLAPASVAGGDVKGWHCVACGRLNIQRNLCIQGCGSCSTSNGLSAAAIEDVRQARGTDPSTFPWNRHAEFVECSSSDAPEGLRRFTYKIIDSALVHHLFTKNRTAIQEQPTQIFHKLQTEIELVAEHVAKVARGAPSVAYVAQFGHASRKNVKGKGTWPSDVPACVSRARELMLRRGCLDGVASKVTISSLTISAWRSHGNKKGLVFSAAQSPVIVLCLGADVELTFSLPPRIGGGTAQKSKRKASRLTLDTDDVGDTADNDYQDSPVLSEKRSTTKKQPKGQKRKQLEEALMVNLVHGDMLVVEGATFEYSLKKAGMCILLIGS